MPEELEDIFGILMIKFKKFLKKIDLGFLKDILIENLKFRNKFK